MMERLNTSQTSRFKNRRNTSKLEVRDNFDELDGNKKQKNPRFFINVKEQIKKSVKALSGAKIGTRFNRNAVPRTIESQRDKVTSKNIISIIRRENMQTDSRPFSAFPLN